LPLIEANDANGSFEWTIQFFINGHSFGGLISRYAVGKLFCDECEVLKNFIARTRFSKVNIADVLPYSYTSISSPHLGSVHQASTPHEAIATRVFLGTLIGESGRDLLERISESTVQKSWLERLSDPGDIFIQSLSMFRYRTLIGFVDDGIVAPLTATMRHSNIRKECSKPRVIFKPENVGIHSYSGFDPLQSYRDNVFTILNSRPDLPIDSTSISPTLSSSSDFLSAHSEAISTDDTSDSDVAVRTVSETDTASPIWPNLRRSLSARFKFGIHKASTDPKYIRKECEIWQEGQNEAFDDVEQFDYETRTVADTATESLLDDEPHVRLCEEVQSLTWRRLILDFGVRNFMTKKVFVHPLNIGKVPPGTPPYLRKQTSELMKFYAELFYFDYTSFAEAQSDNTADSEIN
jgi:hypothetical protein